MNKFEKFETILEMYADLEAIHDNTEYMSRAKRILFEILEGGKQDNTQCEASNSAWLVMTFWKNQVSEVQYLFDNFASAKEYVLQELLDLRDDLYKDDELTWASELGSKITYFKGLDERYFDVDDTEWTSETPHSISHMYLTRVEMNEPIGIEV